MKIDTSLMFEPVKVGAMAAQLEEAGFDGEVVVLLCSRDVDADGSSHWVTR